MCVLITATTQKGGILAHSPLEARVALLAPRRALAPAQGNVLSVLATRALAPARGNVPSVLATRALAPAQSNLCRSRPRLLPHRSTMTSSGGSKGTGPRRSARGRCRCELLELLVSAAMRSASVCKRRRRTWATWTQLARPLCADGVHLRHYRRDGGLRRDRTSQPSLGGEEGGAGDEIQPRRRRSLAWVEVQLGVDGGRAQEDTQKQELRVLMWHPCFSAGKQRWARRDRRFA